ncbi:hypothetical protein FD755_010214, partial [Muntiacus reevesi]
VPVGGWGEVGEILAWAGIGEVRQGRILDELGGLWVELLPDLVEHVKVVLTQGLRALLRGHAEVLQDDGDVHVDHDEEGDDDVGGEEEDAHCGAPAVAPGAVAVGQVGVAVGGPPIFFFEFKMGCKTAQITCNINNTFGSGAANKCTVQWWFKKFCKGHDSLEDEEHSGWLLEVDNNQLTGSLKLILLHENLSTLKQIGKVKQLDKWVPLKLTSNKKYHPFEMSISLILHNNNEPFLNRIVMCDENWIIYHNQKNSKALLKAKFIPKKVMVTVWRSAAHSIYYSFRNLCETITCEKYAQQIDEIKGPVLLHDSAQPHTEQQTLQKLNDLGYEVLPHPPYSPDLSPTHYHFFKHLDNFLQGKCFHNQQEAENAFQEFVKSQGMDFCATGINTHFSLAKMC